VANTSSASAQESDHDFFMRALSSSVTDE